MLLTPLVGLLARLTECLPEFSRQLFDSEYELGSLLKRVIKAYGDSSIKDRIDLHRETVRLLEQFVLISVSKDRTEDAAQKLIVVGAEQVCAFQLSVAALRCNKPVATNDDIVEASHKSSGLAIATVMQLLSVLRAMMTPSKVLHDLGDCIDVSAMRISIAEKFIQLRVPQLLSLLRYTDCMLQERNGRAWQELAHLRALFESQSSTCSELTTADDDVARIVQAAANERAFS